MPNWKVLESFVNQTLTFFGGILVTWNFVTADQVATAVSSITTWIGATTALVGAVWGIWAAITARGVAVAVLNAPSLPAAKVAVASAAPDEARKRGVIA